jgi:hypothetical protein
MEPELEFKKKKIGTEVFEKNLEKGLKPGVNWRLIGNDH